jgi:hypothetical protein
MGPSTSFAGLDAGGQVVYRSPSAAGTPPAPTCFVTPTGQPVAGTSTGPAGCQQAVALGLGLGAGGHPPGRWAHCGVKLDVHLALPTFTVTMTVNPTVGRPMSNVMLAFPETSVVPLYGVVVVL